MKASRPLLFAILLVLGILVLQPIGAQPANPFTGSGGPPPEEAPPPAQGNSFSLRLAQLQGELQLRISRFIRALDGERSGLIWASLLGLGALYGVIHTLLPGHRKTVLFSYFLTEEARPIDGIVAGVSLGLLHAATAVILVVGSYKLIEASINAAVAQASALIQQASAWLIVGLGAFFLIAKLRHLLEHRAHGHGEADIHRGTQAHGVADTGGTQAHGVADTGDDGQSDPAPRARGLRQGRLTLPAIVLSGLVPCPGSTVVLLFSLSLGILTVGIATVSAISFGMAVTLSVISVSTILLKRSILAREGRLGHAIHHAVEIGAAAFMLLFGVGLLFAAGSVPVL